MKIEANTIKELFNASGKKETDKCELDKIIVETAPELKRHLFSGSSITMIGYSGMTWKNKSDSGIWLSISFAPQKNNISIYVAAQKNVIYINRQYIDVEYNDM